MTQRTNSAHRSVRQLRQRLPIAPALPSLLVKSLGCIGGLGILNSGLVLASSVQARPNQRWEKTATNSATDYNGAYIDPTAYKIGATSYEAPSKVVLSERSTGCTAVLRRGGLSGSLCSAAAIPRFMSQHSDDDGSRVLRHSHHRWARSRAVGVARISPSNPNTGLRFPLTTPIAITSVFGWRSHPITGDRRFHSGTDLGAPLGTPVLAAYAGNVAIANDMGGYGLTVVLDHNKPFEETLYGHLSQIFVQPGQWVEQGTVIGRVGSTGNSTGPHLHFEIRQLTPEGWVATDPGAQLQYAMAQLAQALHIAQLPQQLGNRRVEQGIVIRQPTHENWLATDQKNLDLRIPNYFQSATLGSGSSGSNAAVKPEFRISKSEFLLPLNLSTGLISTSEFRLPNLVEPGAQLQYAMAQLVQVLHTAQLPQQPANKG